MHLFPRQAIEAIHCEGNDGSVVGARRVQIPGSAGRVLSTTNTNDGTDKEHITTSDQHWRARRNSLENLNVSIDRHRLAVNDRATQEVPKATACR
jgi:hypothetical protein